MSEVLFLLLGAITGLLVGMRAGFEWCSRKSDPIIRAKFEQGLRDIREEYDRRVGAEILAQQQERAKRLSANEQSK